MAKKKNGIELEFSILDEEFKKAIKEMNTSLSSMRKELNLENEILKSSNASITDYQNKLKLLKQEQDTSKNKIVELGKAYEKAKETFGENSKEAYKYKNALMDAQTEQQKISNDIEKTTKAYEEHKAVLEENERKNKELKSALGTLTSTLSNQKMQLEELKKQYVNTVLEQGKGSAQAKKLKNDISNLNSEINKSENRLNDAEKELKDFSSAEQEAAKHSITFGEMIKANLISEGIKKGISDIANGIKEVGSFFFDMGKQAFEAFGNYEQLVGGVDTLFKDNSNTVQQYANNAYKTSGLSANEYMETVTSFSASLLQSLNGDTAKAAQVADMAITDMSDNANKMGTSMESIQNAYQGFAKQNYTMLDNLKLGYGGTKAEMERLLADAEEFSGIHYDINNLNDVYSAIHIIQTELDITGTTAKEASTTIQGSAASVKSAWTNLLTGLGNKQADLKMLIDNLMDGITIFLDNALPIVETILTSIIESLPSVFELGGEIITRLIDGLVNNIPYLATEAINIVMKLVNTILDNLPKILQAGITLIIELAKGISEALPELVPKIVEVILEMVKILTDPTNLENIIMAALTLIVSLGQGLIDAIPVLLERLPEIINNITKFFTDNLDKIIDTGIDMIVNLAMALVDSIPLLLEQLPTILMALIEGLLKVLPKISTIGLKIIVKLGAALIENIPELLSKIPEVISSAVNAFGELISKAVEIGKNFISGLWDGINSAKDWLFDKIGGFADSVIGGVKNFFGIHSPSRVFRDQVGKNLALGIGEGFTDEMQDVTEIMQESIPKSFDVGIATNFSNSIYHDNLTSNNRNLTDTSDYNIGQVAPIYLTIENFNNNRGQDVEELAEELEFYRYKNSYGKGNL